MASESAFIFLAVFEAARLRNGTTDALLSAIQYEDFSMWSRRNRQIHRPRFAGQCGARGCGPVTNALPFLQATISVPVYFPEVPSRILQDIDGPGKPQVCPRVARSANPAHLPCLEVRWLSSQ